MATNVYVGNLSYETTEETLRKEFGKFGEVQAVNLITDRDTGRPKGFGFVEMVEEAAAMAAIQELNGKSLDGRAIKVDKAKPRTDSGPRRDSRGGTRRPPRW
jgi:RNA recognition motif-containing protein